MSNIKKYNQVFETTRQIAYANGIYAIDRNGIIIASTKANGISIVGHNYAFRPYFKDAWKGRTTVFPVLGDKSNRMELHLSTPIYGSSNESVDGVLALEFDIRVVEDLLYQRVEQIGLVSPQGVIFTSNNPEWIFHALIPMTENIHQRLKKIRQFGNKTILPLHPDVTQKKVQLKEKTYYSAMVSLPISGWKLISLQKKDPGHALAPYYKYLVGAGHIVTGSLALLVFF